ncbi:hypothetical protein LUZ60_005484 [Juncus effusus]|nr:hypothetical protein LUZ60_005484 [Juncus effusus]
MGLGVLLLFLLLCISLSIGDENPSPLIPQIPPNGSPVPLFDPSLAPSPVSPFFNISSGPKLSGKCTLNFSSVDPLITTTATDCLDSFAPYLANVICCPQLDAILSILIGQSSLQSGGNLSLDPAHADHCLSDLQLLLSSRGSQKNLKGICDLSSGNLTGGECAVRNADQLERLVDGEKVLEACRRVDSVNECCSRVCQNEIEKAAMTISGGNDSGLAGCRKVVVRWISGRLEPGPAKKMLRQISNCNVNGVCPLVFPDTQKVAQHCAHPIRNTSKCCTELDAYVAVLAKQSFITNLQALDCAAILAVKLQGRNVTENVYGVCGVSLKDFSIQVGTQESGCLLPSMPSDVTLDPVSGVSFTCDLNDNIAAPWATSLLSSSASSSCSNKSSVNLPALPAATSMLNGVGKTTSKISFLASLFLMVLQVLLQA